MCNKKIIEELPYKLNYSINQNYKLKKAFDDAKFMNNNYDFFESNNYITGYVNGNFLEISNVEIRKVNLRGHLERCWTGMMSCNTINKKVEKEIRIKRNNNIKNSNNTKIDTGNVVEFEKYFTVCGDANSLRNGILTNNLMEQILQIYNMYQIDFEIVIKENKIYIKCDTGNIFEGGISGKSTNMNDLFMCYIVMNFIMELITKINEI